MKFFKVNPILRFDRSGCQKTTFVSSKTLRHPTKPWLDWLAPSLNLLDYFAWEYTLTKFGQIHNPVDHYSVQSSS
jgi:hypothetical protein